MTIEKHLHILVWLVPTTALGVALLQMPYGYYQLLRVLLFCVACFFALSSREAGRHGWSWIFVGLAIIYNPVMKLHLGRDIWSVVNVATMLLLLAHMVQHRKATLEV